MVDSRYEVERLATPLSDDLSAEAVAFWTDIFPDCIEEFREFPTGSESESNTNILYLARSGKEIAATCCLTISRTDGRLGGIGEVATRNQFRGRGLASELCRRAAEEFDSAGGRGLWLGTNNPAAASVYNKMGWQYLVGTMAMVRTDPRHTPEQFLIDYYRRGLDLAVDICPGGAGERITMIPLILTPHPWKVLDANVGICSIRWFRQESCMGLYSRYQRPGDSMMWWSAKREDGACVGLASAKWLDQKTMRSEAFCHPWYQENLLGELHRHVAIWAIDHGADQIVTTCECRDHAKHGALMQLKAEPKGRSCQMPGPLGQLQLMIFELGRTML